MSDREAAQKAFADRQNATIPSAFNAIGAFNKYYDPKNTGSSLALSLDMGKSVPPTTRASAIASYNAKNPIAPKAPDQPGFWGKIFAGMETAYNFTSQVVSFGLSLDEKTNPLWQGSFDVNKVKKAWDASRDISPGQAVMRQLGQAVDPFDNAFNGIVKTVSGGKLSGTDKFMQDHILFAANDFDIFDKNQRKEAFSNQAVGRIGSWSTDVVARFVIDPTIFAGKAVKAYKGISTAVKGVDELKAIMAGEKTGFKATKVKNTFNSFLESTDNMNEADLFRIKSIRESSNPATFSSLIAEANNIVDKTARHQAKADIIFMAQGDMQAATRLLETNELIAAKVGKLRDEVAAVKYMGEGVDKATGQITFDLVNKGTDAEAAKILITQHEDELARIHKQLEGEAILDPNKVPKVDILSNFRQGFSGSQAFIDLRAVAPATSKLGAVVPLNAGVSYGTRVLTGFFYKRPKGWIDFQDNQSVQTIDNMLSRVRGVSDKQAAVYAGKIRNIETQLKVGVKDKTLSKSLNNQLAVLKDDMQKAAFTVERKDALFAKYTSAVDTNARALAYREIEAEIFSTIARQYGFSDDAVKKAWSTFNEGRQSVQNLIRENAYTGSSAAAIKAGKKTTPIIGAEDASYIMALPLNETQLVHQLPTLHIEQMYNSLNKYTRGARFDNGGKVYKTTRRGQEIGSELTQGLDSLIKFEVLARVGYPVRNVTEGLMRTVSVVGPMAIIKAASGASGNVIANRFVGSTFHDIFKWSNTVKMQTKRAQLVAERTIANNPELIDSQIAMIDKMLLNPNKVKDTLGMGLNQVDGILYKDAMGASAEEAKAISDMFIKNAAKIVDDAFIESHKSLSNVLEMTGDFTRVYGDNPLWSASYERVINRQVRNSEITKRLLAGESVDDVEKFLLTTKDGRDIVKKLAMGREVRDIVEANAINVDSLFPQGTEALREIAKTRRITSDDVQKFFGNNIIDRPPVNGAQVGNANATSAVAKTFSNILEGFYKIAGEIPETKLVRNPLFIDLYRKRMEASIRNAMESYPGDTIPPAYMQKLENSARQWSRAELRRTLYDTSERVESAHTLKYIYPFFGAFADVAQKWGRILVDDPGKLRTLETVYDAPDRMGIVEERDGLKYINIPGEWAKRMTLGFSDRPMSVPKASLNLIFQGGAWWNPGFGWFVQHTASALVTKIPDLEKTSIMKEILPYGPSGTGWQELVIQSAGLRKILAIFDENDPMRTNLTVTIAMEENHKYDMGLRPTAPTKAEINDRAVNILRLEATSRLILPFATNTKSPYQFYIDEYQRMRQEDAAGATEKFWNAYGDDYFIFTTSRSKNNTGVNASIEADKRASQLSDLIDKNPEYGWFVIGDANNGEFSPTIYKKQQGQPIAPGSTTKFREKQDPYEAIASTQAEKGWLEYNKAMDLIESQRISRGLKSVNSKGGEDLAQMKREFIDDLSASNPAWSSVRGRIDTNKVNNFLQFATKMVDDPRVKNRQDIKVMQDYLVGREYIRQVLAGRNSQVITNASNTDVKELWDEFIGDLIDKNITFNKVYTRILENDDLRKGF
jgi:hypothetical protein